MADAKDMIHEINNTFEHLKEAVEKKADGEQINRIQDALDEMELKMQRVSFGGETKNVMTDLEKKEVEEFKSYARTGSIGESLEKKAMSSDSNPDGGIFLPENIASNIITRLRKISPIRQVADIITISKGNEYKLPREKGGEYESGWVGERQERPTTGNDTFEIVKIPVHEMYAEPKITQTLLDDSAFNFESYIADRIANRFAQLEGTAFVRGNGVNQPEGFLNNNEIEQITAKLDFDGLLKLVYGLDAEYSNGAVFMCKRSTIRDIRTLKDNNGQYLWQPSTQIGQPATVLGYGIHEADDMPVAAAGGLPIAFGNFREGYQIVDKQGFVTIRDNLTSKPWIKFYTTKRVGGGVKKPETIKILKQS
ncbi:phage major capsid protein [Clostridium botulinum]|uniref:phage major capsid protein n=1 Tax=Clostridium botulinum TaxID=1491 RepID=UPI000774C711|nr:phage major capsid protein [Clostridium botulinum]